MFFNVKGFGDKIVDGAGMAAGWGSETFFWGDGRLAERGRLGRARVGLRVDDDTWVFFEKGEWRGRTRRVACGGLLWRTFCVSSRLNGEEIQV